MTFLNKNVSKRNILLKMIYLTQKNKLFEVREIINKKLKSDKHYKKLQYHIKKEINFKKLKFIFFAPILFLKKIYLRFFTMDWYYWPIDFNKCSLFLPKF